MNRKLVELIQFEFNALLQEKTNWGRNEIKQLHDKAIARAAIRILDQVE